MNSNILKYNFKICSHFMLASDSSQRVFDLQSKLSSEPPLPSKGSRSSKAASSSRGSFNQLHVNREQVQAREASFQKYSATENDMTLKKGAPMLLKPNGAPVFAENSELERTQKKKGPSDLEWDKDTDTGEWQQRTVKRNERLDEADGTRTAKAHNFKIANKVVNQTNIQVLDVQNSSAAQELAVPFRVLYVNPSTQKRPHSSQLTGDGVRRNANGVEIIDGSRLKLVNKAQRSRDLQALEFRGFGGKDIDNNLQDVSGIFKKRASTAQEKRRNQSKAYAEKVREEAKTKLKKPQNFINEPESMTQTHRTQHQVEAAKLRLPHSKNRFKGEFSHLDLFKKAQEKLVTEKIEKEEVERAALEKKERDAAYLRELADKNKRLVKVGGEKDVLKKREEERKMALRREELQVQADARRALRDKRASEGRGVALGLDQASRSKLRKLQAEKMEAEAQRALEERAKVLAAKRIRDENSQKRQLSRDARLAAEQEDDEAQPMVDRKAILREQREKRRLNEMKKAQEERDKLVHKQEQLAQLDRLRREQLKEAAKLKKEQDDRRSLKQMRKRGRSKQGYATATSVETKGHHEQLTDLRDWIEDQLDHTQGLPKQAEDLPEEQIELKKNAQSTSPVRSKKGTIDQSSLEQGPDHILTKYGLPGNNMIPPDLERAIHARKNRYGVESDNGFSSIAEAQLAREGIILQHAGSQQNMLDFTKDVAPSPPKSHAHLAVKLGGQQMAGGRAVVNKPVPDEAFSPSRTKGQRPPGLLDIREEASRQRAEEEQRRRVAAVEIQRRARGWQDRRRVRKLRGRMRYEIEEDHKDFTNKYKQYDSYNLNRFLNDKKALRKKIGTEDIDHDDDSIQEKIGDSLTMPPVEDQGRISTTQRNAMAKLFYGGASASEKDPYSIIALYAKRHAAPAPQPDPTSHVISEKKKPKEKMKRRTQRQQKKMVGKKPSASSEIEEDIPMASSSQGKEAFGDDEVEEDIDADDDGNYSNDFEHSEQIGESLPSKAGRASKASSGIIEESIAESIIGSATKNQIQESSITEEENIRSARVGGQLQRKKSVSSIDEDIPDEAGSASHYDDISEESHLKGSGAKRPAPAKVERARDNIVSDFNRDGHSDLRGPIQSRERRLEVQREAEYAAKLREEEYKNSRQIIDDFEREHNMREGGANSAHDKLLRGLADEIKRYEAAVSGQIFAEQFQGIVSKSLAKKDMMMLGQRLSQLEAENRHKQEIADIRAEQIRMLSQLMLLTAGQSQMQGGSSRATNEALLKQQQDLMGQIQSALEIPVQKQQANQYDLRERAAAGPREDPIGESVASKRSAAVLRQAPHLAQSVKYSSIGESALVGSAFMHSRGRNDEIEDEIDDEVGSYKTGSQIEESIKESFAQSSRSRQSDKDPRTGMRRALGSEQAIINQSKEVLGQSPSQNKQGAFNKHSFQDFTSQKYKDVMLTDEQGQMTAYLSKIEDAVINKQQKEQALLQRQFDSRKISPRTYKNKKSDLERWVSRERAELQQKRRQVEDATQDIKKVVKRLEEDRNVVMDQVNAAGNDRGTPRSRRKQHLQDDLGQSAESEQTRAAREQLEQLMDGPGAGDKPETKYLNKKREFVRQLVSEKRDAIERGVQNEMGRLEGEMIDDMMRTALDLDVEAEINRRVNLARTMAEQSAAESLSKSISTTQVSGRHRSQMNVYDDSISKSGSLATKPRKNVRFQQHLSDERTPISKQSRSEQQIESSLSRSGKKDGHDLDADESIGESIMDAGSSLHESSASRLKDSALSSSKVSRRKGKGVTSQIEEVREEDQDDSLDRGSDDQFQQEVEASIEKQKNQHPPKPERQLTADDKSGDGYSNDFISESIQSGSSEANQLKSASVLQSKIDESAGYSEGFEEISHSQAALAQSAKGAKDGGQDLIEPVKEEDSAAMQSSHGQSENARQSPEAEEGGSIMEDREILESTHSVEWHAILQERERRLAEASHQSDSIPAASAKDGSSDGKDKSDDVEEEIELEEEEDEEEQSVAKASVSASGDIDEAQADRITDELLSQILGDFERDTNVRLEVEDAIDEAEYEDKWPWNLEKRAAEEERLKREKAKADQEAAKKAQEEEQKRLEQESRKAETEAKEKHDAALKKCSEEQAELEEQRKKNKEYLEFVIKVVDRETVAGTLSKPIEHDPLKVLERIQAFDLDEHTVEMTNMTVSQQQAVLPPYLFDEIEQCFEEAMQNQSVDEMENRIKSPGNLDRSRASNSRLERGHGRSESMGDATNFSQEARNIHHLAIFDAFNEALDQERPYKVRGLPNPWSKQTRVTHDMLTQGQVDAIVQRAIDKVSEWDKTGAGTKYAPAPPPPPVNVDGEPQMPLAAQQESEEERNKFERQERLGYLLTKEVHQREHEWLDYETEDTQVRFDIADMILEELADEATQFLMAKHGQLEGMEQLNSDGGDDYNEY